LTKDGVVMGSPGWIPPERLTGRPATSGSDVFGWGCLVAYAGTGRNPFGEGDGDELARRMIHEPPDLDGLDESLRRLVTAALAKDPADRPRSAELLARLGADVTTPNDVRRRRRPPLVPVLAAVAVAAVAAGVTAAVTSGSAQEDRRPAPGRGTVASPGSGTPSLRLRGHAPPWPESVGTAPQAPGRTAPGHSPVRTTRPATAPRTTPAKAGQAPPNGGNSGKSKGGNGKGDGNGNGNGKGKGK
jgi:serine/threonine protein kinase